jgi:hypothetical protein
MNRQQTIHKILDLTSTYLKVLGGNKTREGRRMHHIYYRDGKKLNFYSNDKVKDIYIEVATLIKNYERYSSKIN